ncbi:type II toxin-antitoxin system death-on-curing family toxin [Nocardia sp. NPDC058666]|uniref:type II toxin-antitoxin system death-on-curing family toxin n=1 Tax=unclassified Nocardia TaxID=2637762 RepID=UPI00365506F1
MTVAYLDISELLTIAAAVNGTDASVGDYGLLASAAHRPQATVFGQDAYPTLHMKAAALLHSIARNHALVDGNKRTAFLAAAMMLRINGVRLRPMPTEQEILMNEVATGVVDVTEIADRLKAWSA